MYETFFGHSIVALFQPVYSYCFHNFHLCSDTFSINQAPDVNDSRNLSPRISEGVKECYAGRVKNTENE